MRLEKTLIGTLKMKARELPTLERLRELFEINPASPTGLSRACLWETDLLDRQREAIAN